MRAAHQTELAALVAEKRRQSLYRVSPTGTALSPTVREINGREVLVFCSNDYLGLSFHPQVVSAAQEALAQGTASTGSRLLSGGMSEHAGLETALAQFKGQEAALLYGTGYMANVGVLTALARAGDTIFSDALNHASIVDACRLSRAKTVIYPHADVTALRELLRGADSSGRNIIVTDTVFSMDGDIAPLPELAELAQQFGAWLLLDDAHGTGTVGPGGRGAACVAGIENVVDAHIGTCSKALASQGGFVVSSATLREALVQVSRPFIFSTTQPPLAVAAARAALAVLQAEPARVDTLRRNAQWLRSALQESGFCVPDGETPILPLVVGSAEVALKLSHLALERGVWLSAVRPPTVPEGQSRLRLTVSALHTPEQLAQCVAALQEAARECGQKLGPTA